MSKRDTEKQRELPWDPWDGEYIGNIWGWKFSFISLGIILFFLFIAIYRFAALDPNGAKTTNQTEISVDSTAIE
ncbi:MAG: putative MFS family arabinose efflux permease [Polaribacter sp.]|jgi:predicted MFS family arabinose efflux permease